VNRHYKLAQHRQRNVHREEQIQAEATKKVFDSFLFYFGTQPQIIE
jgi:hypothetical protein